MPPSLGNNTGAAAPPPPPPPPNLGMGKGGMDMSSLATQLKNAKLKSSQKKSSGMPASTVTENSGSSTSSGGSGNYGTIGRTTPMASMLDEMAQTLARRRERQQEKKEVIWESFFTV